MACQPQPAGPLLCRRRNRLDLLPVNLNAGFLAHEVEQDPDAGVAGHLLHGGDETFKWA